MFAFLVVLLGALFQRRSLLDCTNRQVGLACILVPVALAIFSAVVLSLTAGLVALAEVISAWRSGADLDRPRLLLAFEIAVLVSTVWLGARMGTDWEMASRAGRTDVTAESLERVATWAAARGDESGLRMLAISFRGAPKLFAQLAGWQGGFVRSQVARHPECPEAVVAPPASDPARSVRHAVAASPRVTTAQLATLSHDADPGVAASAMHAPHRCSVDGGAPEPLEVQRARPPGRLRPEDASPLRLLPRGGDLEVSRTPRERSSQADL
jgi:hypothetical protein